MDQRLNVGRVATVVVAPPEPTSRTVGAPSVSAMGGLSLGLHGAEVEGRMSLGLAALGIAGLLGFYYWTRTAQGGG